MIQTESKPAPLPAGHVHTTKGAIHIDQLERRHLHHERTPKISGPGSEGLNVHPHSLHTEYWHGGELVRRDVHVGASPAQVIDHLKAEKLGGAAFLKHLEDKAAAAAKEQQ